MSRATPRKSRDNSRDAPRDREVVAGLARGLRVLEVFNETDNDLTLSDVARRASLTPAAARRSLRTLAQLGYVANIDRRYLLTARVLSLGSSYLRSANVEGTLQPELRLLVERFGDTAGIAVLIDTNILYIAHYCTPRGVRPVASTGVTYPAYATSLGRVLLAYQSEAEIDRYFAAAQFAQHTRMTETNPKRLRTALRQIRKAGFGTIVDQLFYGVTSISVPILNAKGEAIAALNTSAYTGQTSVDDLIKSRLQAMQASALRLSEIFGNHPLLLKSLQIAPEPPDDRQRTVPATRFKPKAAQER